jgi:hypothetical protein
VPRGKPYLTKSRFLGGLDCDKWLWLTWHDPPPYEPPAPGSIQETGIEIGRKAHLLFPGGILVEAAPWEHSAGRESTTELLTDRSVPAIFEGAFEYDGVRVRVDVLERLSRDAWRLYEVKSSTGAKPEHIPDLAVQAYVLRGDGLRVKSMGVVHVNREYERGKRGINWKRFFRSTDVTEEVETAIADVPKAVAAQHKVLRKRKVPDITASRGCSSGCDFWDRCTAVKPDDWVYYLPRLSRPRFDALIDLGIEAISNIPKDFPLTANQNQARSAIKTGEPIVSPDLWKALQGYGPPAYYMDFETMIPAVPLYPGTRPYQMIPFQWSLHHLDDDGKLSHEEFLADGRTDPRRGFAETLIEAVGASEQPILVYSSFERRILGELKCTLPDLRDPLDAIIVRLRDLLIAVRGRIYHPDFHGSYSMKSVGPALAPSINYDELDHVADGLAAAGTFERLASGTLGPDDDAVGLRAALLEYCKLDTLAMVKVHRALIARSDCVSPT